MMSKISFIGAGKVAHSLSKALAGPEYKIDCIVSRSIHSAKALANQFENCRFSIEYSEALSSEIIFISVNDEQIESTAQAVYNLNIDLTGKIFIHLSGAQNSDSIKILKERNASVASLHIMQTFPSKKTVEIKNMLAAAEADDKTFPLIFNLAKSIGLKPFRISSEGKIYYHLAGVFASNMLVSEYSNAENMFAQSWEGDISPAQLLKPIMERTLNNLAEKGTAASLSGPVERGDFKTIENHIIALKDNKLIKLNYISGSLNLLEISFKKGSVDREKYSSIQNYLKTELKKCISEFQT